MLQAWETPPTARCHRLTFTLTLAPTEISQLAATTANQLTRLQQELAVTAQVTLAAREFIPAALSKKLKCARKKGIPLTEFWVLGFWPCQKLVPPSGRLSNCAFGKFSRDKLLILLYSRLYMENRLSILNFFSMLENGSPRGF